MPTLQLAKTDSTFLQFIYCQDTFCCLQNTCATSAYIYGFLALINKNMFKASTSKCIASIHTFCHPVRCTLPPPHFFIKIKTLFQLVKQTNNKIFHCFYSVARLQCVCIVSPPYIGTNSFNSRHPSMCLEYKL